MAGGAPFWSRTRGAGFGVQEVAVDWGAQGYLAAPGERCTEMLVSGN